MEGNDEVDTTCGKANNSNFKALLRFSGDDVLKKYLDTSNLNSSYVSRHIRNKIIDTCDHLILTKIVN